MILIPDAPLDHHQDPVGLSFRCARLARRCRPLSPDPFRARRNGEPHGRGLRLDATQDNSLLFGTTSDTFLQNDAPQRYTGLNPAAPLPAMTLGGKPALNNFYRDDQGGFTGLHSIMGFYFGTVPLNGLLDLSSLDGVYTLQESRFSDFRVGTYHGLVSGTRPNMLQGLGEITLWVVPEPGAGLLTGTGLLLAAGRRRRSG